MNPPTSFDDFDRGQVGIGTLIIFIALVLVAAVAAGVLVNTAGDLQSKAAATGEDAQAGVSNQIDVVSATGYDADNGGDKDIDTVELVIKKSAGSDDIDLSQATIQYNSGDSLVTLTYQDNPTTDQRYNTFTTTAVGGGDDTRLSDTSQRVKIILNTAAIEYGADWHKAYTNGGVDADTNTQKDDSGDPLNPPLAQPGLEEGSSVDLTITDQSGASTSYAINVPSVLQEQYVSL